MHRITYRREKESRSENLQKTGKERSIEPPRIVNKHTRDEGRSDENPDDSLGDCEPSHQLSHVRGTEFAAEHHEMSYSKSHHLQPQHIGHHDNMSNCESPPSLSSSQNAVFAFYSQSQSSEATSPQQPSVSQFSRSFATYTSGDENIQESFSPKIQENRRSKQQKKYHTNNCALETTNDKIDEDALSAWWFLGSKSDSFEDASDNKREIEHISNDKDESRGQRVSLEKGKANESPVDSKKNRRNENAMSWVLRSFSAEASPSMKSGSINSLGSVNSALELAETKSPHTYIQHQKSSLSDRSKAVAKIARSSMQTRQLHRLSQSNEGGCYTIKEQQNRKEWLVAIGETVKYEESAHEDYGESSSLASYQLVLPQKSTLQIDTKSSMCSDRKKSPDWDPSMLRTYQMMNKPYFEDWTPQDSSYGAAVPAFGWIPKRIRKLIEIVFLLLVTAVLIYVVVKLGIILIGNEHSSSAGGVDMGIWNDDDHYIANNANNNVNQGDVDDNE